MAKKVSIKNYEKATYKTKLSLEEYDSIVSSVINSIISLYNQGVYGFNTYMINRAMIEVCTNINLGGIDFEVIYKFCEDTDIISKIRTSITDEVFDKIMYDINMGLRYRASTNPDTKLLIEGIIGFISNLSKNTEHISDETLMELMGTVKALSIGVDDNASK